MREELNGPPAPEQRGRRRGPRGGAAAALLWAAGVAVAVLIVLSLIPCVRFLPTLLGAGEPGFRWRFDARTRVMTVEAVEPLSPAATAGLRPGDRITRIQGREASPALDLWGPPGQWVLGPGDLLKVEVARGSTRWELRWPLAWRPWAAVTFAAGGWRLGFDQAFHACYLVAMLATGGLGAWVLSQKPQLLSARAFAGLSWTLCLAQLGSVVAHAPRERVSPVLFHLVFANDGWARMALATGIYFLLTFPEPKPLLRRHPRAVAALIFAPALLLLAAHGALAHSMWRFQFLEGRPRLAPLLDLLETIDWWGYAFPAALLLLGLLLFSYRTAQGGPARRQLAAICLSGTPLMLLTLTSSLMLILTGSVPIGISLAAPLLFLAWPVGLGYAVISRGAFDVNRAMRRGVAYALSTIAVAALCFSVAALIGQRVIEQLGTGYTGLVIAGAALLALPVWGGVQHWVDRRFGRDRLASLGRLESVSSEIATILDPELLTAALTERVAAVLGVKRAALFGADGNGDAFALLRASGLEASEATPAALSDTLGAARGAEEPLTFYVPEEDAERLGLSPEEGARVERAGLVFWMPLRRGGESGLILALGWKRGEDVYTREEIALLRVLGSQAAAAWENIRLLQEREARVRVEQEVAIGRAIQMRLLPPCPLFFGDFRIDARCEPAAEVGGDFYNVFTLPSQESAVGIILGDVSGKGVPGALYMAVVSSLIEGLAQGTGAAPSASELLARANERVYPKLRPLRMFATTLCAVLDTTHGRLALANAGQLPPLLWRADAEPEFVRLSGLPLGARAGSTYEECALELRPGDLCLFASDGLLDPSNPQGYGELCRRLPPEARQSPRALLDALYAVAGQGEADDRTVLVLSRGVWPPAAAPLPAG